MRARLQKQARLLRNRGVFWGHSHFLLTHAWAGYNVTPLAGKFLRHNAWALLDGTLGGGFLPRYRKRGKFAIKRLRGASARLSGLSPHGVNPLTGWAWAILRYLRARSYRGFRYRLGLPARGQRTRSNAATASSGGGVVAAYLKSEGWVERVWETAKRQRGHLPRKFKSMSKRALKAIRHRKGVIRTKKKPSVWR